MAVSNIAVYWSIIQHETVMYTKILRGATCLAPQTFHSDSTLDYLK